MLWQDIDQHVQETLCKGVPVKAIRFGQSRHVEHARRYADYYWEGILKIWNEAILEF